MSFHRAIFSVLIAFVLTAAALPAFARQEVTLTTTGDFQLGNSEGLVSIAGNQITRTPMNAGPLGSFNTGTALPDARIYHSSVAYNGHVYVIGGVDVGPITTAEVRTASFNADGTVGAWTTTTALPSARYGHTAVVHNGYIFVIGGLDASSALLADAIAAPIHADGTLGEWTSTTPIPVARHSHGAAAFNGFMYVGGGSSSFTPGVAQLTEVYVAAIGTDGTLGEWTATTPLPTGRAKLSIMALGGHLYSLGGFDGSAYALPSALTAPIAGDGTIGAWSETQALPISPGMYAFGIVVVEGSVITTGGYAYSTGVPLQRNEVLINTPPPDPGSAAQLLPLLKGEYSRLVDFGSDRLVNGIEINGSAPSGGKVRLQYRLATSANPGFGPEQVVNSFPLGSGVAIPGTARWLWVRLTLDDSGRTDSLASVTANPTYVTDITIGGLSGPDKLTGLSPSGSVSVPTDGGGPVSFQWSALKKSGLPVAGAKYDLQVSLDATFQTTLHNLTDLVGTSTSVEIPLSPSDQKFSWRVRGADPAIPDAESEWSDVMTFSVVKDDLIDHGAGDCAIATGASSGPPTLAILGLIALVAGRGIRRR